MPRIEIVNEPTPEPSFTGRGKMTCTLRGIDSKTGKEIWTTQSLMSENERRERTSRKY